jgi:hypothetical protein
MNVISARTSETTSALVCAFTTAGAIALPRREPAEWLPSPPCRPRPLSPTRRLMMPKSSHAPAEKVFLALIAGLAMFAIAYGFSCALDLVQNWAQFNAGIERLVQ